VNQVPRSTPRSFIGRVRDRLNDLPSAERRLGEFVLDFPGELASYTATELAKMAAVSNATVTRFFRNLGYASFDVARRQVRTEQQGGGALFLTRSTGQAGDGSTAAHLQQGHRNIDATFNRLPESSVADLAQTIVAARQVWVVGYRTSHSFATYLRWQIIQVMEHVTVLPAAGETLGEYTASIAATDCVVVFGLRRTVPQIVEITDRAASVGAKIAYITDRPGIDPVKVKWLIRCETTAPGPLYNHVAVMAVCDLLATKVLEAAGRAGRRRMAAVESAHDAFRELD
jgi:DNA-binding MurR/RpiR family transcriptional regulator